MSTIQPIVGASLSSEALDTVVAAITSGEFLPGARLSEAELARRLGISRGPLREALGRLEGRLVTRTPRIGVRVIELSKQNIIDLFYAREAPVGMCARLARSRSNDKQLAQLRQLRTPHTGQAAVAGGGSYSPRALDDDFSL